MRYLTFPRFYHMGKFLILIVFSIILLLSPVKSYNFTYIDVTDNSPFKEAISSATERGYVNGYGNGYFGPDDAITMSSFLTVCCNKYFQDELTSQETLSRDTVTSLAIQHKLVSQYEAKNKDVTWDFMLETLLNLSSLPIYSSSAWQDKMIYPELTVPKRNILSSATHYGLLTGIEMDSVKLSMAPTRAEVMQVIFNLENSSSLHSLPPIADKVKIVAKEGSVSVRDLNTIYESIQKVPAGYLDKFHTAGWKFCVSRDSLNNLSPEYHNMSTIQGITSFEDKTIYLYSGALEIDRNTILHEVGHFIAYRNGRDSIPSAIFNDERSAIKDFFRTYTVSSSDETFADTFSYFCKYRDDAERLREIYAAIPKTASYVWDNYFSNIV